MQATCRPTEDLLPLRPSKPMINLEIYHKRVIISNKNKSTLHVVEINNGTSFYALYAWRQLYRDSCSISGKMKAGGAAEPMLCDFVQLLPELWREKLYSKRSFVDTFAKVCSPLGATLDAFCLRLQKQE